MNMKNMIYDSPCHAAGLGAAKIPLCAQEKVLSEWTRRVIVQKGFVFQSTMTQVQEGFVLGGSSVLFIRRLLKAR